ncbi:MAG: GAF domain-containing protein, partial [Phycisphaerae bacterium]
MNELGVKQLRVLVLGKPDAEEEIARLGDTGASMTHVDTLAAALAAMRDEAFDVVVSSPGELKSVETLPAMIRSVARAHAAARTGDTALAIVDDAGRFLWADRRMLGFGEALRGRLARACVDALASSRRTEAGGCIDVPAERFDFTTISNERFEVTATPICNLVEPATHVAVVVRDTTSADKFDAITNAIDHAGRELISVDVDQFSRLTSQERLALLEQKIIRHTKDLLHFDGFCVRMLDRATNQLELVLASDMPDAIAQRSPVASAEGEGICGRVAAIGRSYICPDVAGDPYYRSGFAGAHSSLTVALKRSNHVVGVLNLESTTPGAFGDDDRRAAERFGGYVALALNIIDMLAHEQSTAGGRAARRVRAEITGPLNDILVGVDHLSEDYSADGGLCARLTHLTESANAIRDAVNGIASRRPGVVGAARRAEVRSDPVLAGRRVLVADDEDVIRDTVRDVLAGYGCTVSAVADGLAATELVATRRFDLVLSDIKMPGKN